MKLDKLYQEKLGDFNGELHLLLISPYGDENSIGVIDNQFDWEINEFHTISDKQFYDLDEAIYVAKKLADKHNLRYIPFESRYCHFFEEKFESSIEQDIEKFIKEYKDGD